MEVAPPPDTEAVRRMERDGYLYHTDDRTIDLTEKGREVALTLMRRHRMVERWLTDVLGLDWASAHEEAHRLEHVLCEVVPGRIWQSIGCPDSCPHGNPIRPLAPDGAAERLRLRDIDRGQSVTLQRISELAQDNRELMTYLDQNGFRPGVRIDVTGRGPLNDTLTVTVGGETAVISHELAGYLWVRRAS